MKRVGAISIAVLFLLLGTTALTYGQQEQQGDKQDEHAKPKQAKPKDAEPKQAQDAHPAKPSQRQKDQGKQQDHNKQQQERAQQQQQQDQDKQQQREQQPQVARLSQQRQQQLVAQQQQERLTQYRQDLDKQQRVLQQQTAQLQQQKQMAQYRFQQEYLDHLHQQQMLLQNDRHPEYDRDPFFYTAPSYRYTRGGHYYETNQYGADLLRQAVNFGYEEGFRAGEADRSDHWRSSYQDCYAYQDANYGYNGYYVDRDDYNYYFREGFRRGYEDGYSSRYRYGRYENGSYNMLDAILSQVLGFQSLR